MSNGEEATAAHLPPRTTGSLAGRAHSAPLLERVPPAIWATFALLAGLVDFWGNRYSLNPDGVAYIELAQHALANGPREVISGYWSSGYPILLAPVLGLMRSRWMATIPALHLVNLVLFLVSLIVFLILLRDVSTGVTHEPPDSPVPIRSTVAFGVVAFTAIALQGIGLGLLTPDFGVMLAVLATALCCLRIERSTHSAGWAVGLGVVLGLGYWMKGVLLPLNILLLIGLMVVPPHTDRARAKVALASGVFALVSLPLIALVSIHVGRFTVGEVGRLNYAWAVDDVTPFVGWLGDSTGRAGAPLHPPHLLQPAPQTLEFGAPIRATYPLWFDPSYWYAGVRPRFDAGGQWRALRQGVSDLATVMLDQWALIAALLGLGVATKRRSARSVVRPSRIPVVIGAWSAAAAITYALVHVESRYLAGFIAVCVVITWAWLVARSTRRAWSWMMIAAVVALVTSLARYLIQNTGGFELAYKPDYITAADTLRSLGVSRGEHIAAVGDAFEVYAAFVAGTPITAQVMDSVGFWQLAPSGRLALQQRLAATGVKALLANDVDAGKTAEGWHIIQHPDSSNVGILRLGVP